MNVAYSLTVSSFVFYVYKENLRFNNLKTRTAMNTKISVFVICFELTKYDIICMAIP